MVTREVVCEKVHGQPSNKAGQSSKVLSEIIPITHLLKQQLFFGFKAIIGLTFVLCVVAVPACAVIKDTVVQDMSLTED